MDKSFWNAIVENDYAIPEGHTVQELTPELLSFLASSDIDVRDPFGYMIYAHWMVRDKHYSPEDIRKTRDQLLSNLDKGLGEKDTDSIFLRSFSMLNLSLIVYYDLQEPFLTEDEISNLLIKSLDYFKEEKDLRGFVEGKGWAHSAAHTADMLKFLARSPKSNKDNLQQILDSISEKLFYPVKSYVYVHNEDERLVMALIDVLKRDLLALNEWKDWIQQFVDWKNEEKQGDFQPEIHAIWLNTKNLLRSFYFRLELTDELPAIAEAIKLQVFDAIKVFGQW